MNKRFLVMAFLACASLGLAQEQRETDPPKAQDRININQKREIPAAVDSLKTPADSLKSSSKSIPVSSGEELELEEIAIQAVIEKPNVDIIPKRVKPTFEEMRFIDRSFSHELKQIPKDLLLLGDELDQPKKVDALKKVIEKTKEKGQDK